MDCTVWISRSRLGMSVNEVWEKELYMMLKLWISVRELPLSGWESSPALDMS